LRIWLTRRAVKTAKNLILRHSQQLAFSQEMESLKQDRTIKRSSSIFRLDPFLEDGLLQVGSRIKFGKLMHNTKHPILIPKSSPIVRLILNDAHYKLGHIGRQHVLSYVRSTVIAGLSMQILLCIKFWLIASLVAKGTDSQRSKKWLTCQKKG